MTTFRTLLILVSYLLFCGTKVWTENLCQKDEIYYCEGKCLYVSKLPEYYADAEQICNSRSGSNLVTTPHEGKWLFVSYVTRGLEHWLGLKKLHPDTLNYNEPLAARRANWTWARGEQYSPGWHKWAEVISDIEHKIPLGVSKCASTDKQGYWRDDAICYKPTKNKRAFVCERDISHREACPHPSVYRKQRNTETPSDSSNDDTGFLGGTWMYVAIAVGTLVLLLVIITVAVVSCRRRASSSSTGDKPQNRNTDLESGYQSDADVPAVSQVVSENCRNIDKGKSTKTHKKKEKKKKSSFKKSAKGKSKHKKHKNYKTDDEESSKAKDQNKFLVNYLQNVPGAADSSLKPKVPIPQDGSQNRETVLFSPGLFPTRRR